MPICDATQTGDVPLTPDQVKIFTDAYKIAAPIGNPCFYGAWTVGAGAVGTAGAVAANLPEIGTGLAENYPSLFQRALNWLLGRGRINPGSLTAARQAVPIIFNKIETTCSQLQGR